MTSPRWAQSVPGKGRWYTLPTGEQYPSVTNVLDVAVSKPALVGWSAKATAAKAFELLPSMVSSSRKASCAAKRVADRCGVCRTCVEAAIKAAHIDAKDAAADLGTRVHDLAEAHVLGRPVAHDPEAEPYVAQLLRFWVDFGVDPAADYEATEMTVVNRTAGYAGTLDALVWLEIAGVRTLTLLDYKSSATRAVESVYPENGMQVAALAHAETALLDDGTEVAIPGPIEAAAILNLRTDGYALVPMPVAGTLTDAFAAFRGALATASYLHFCYGAKPTLTVPRKEA